MGGSGGCRGDLPHLRLPLLRVRAAERLCRMEGFRPVSQGADLKALISKHIARSPRFAVDACHLPSLGLCKARRGERERLSGATAFRICTSGKGTSLGYHLFSSEKNAPGGSEVAGQCSDLWGCQRSVGWEDPEGIGSRGFLLQNSLPYCACSFFAASQSIAAELIPSGAQAGSERPGSTLGPGYRACASVTRRLLFLGGTKSFQNSGEVSQVRAEESDFRGLPPLSAHPKAAAFQGPWELKASANSARAISQAV